MEKLAKTGIKGLDEFLGGGIPRGTSILLLEEPGTKGATFAMKILCEGLAKGEYGQFVSYNQPPPFVRSLADDLEFNVRPYEKAGKLQIIDGYTQAAGLKQTPTDVEHVIEDISDLSKVHRTITLARASLGEKADNNLRFVHHTFSALMLFAGDAPVLKLMRHLTVAAKLRGSIGIFILNPNSHNPTTVSWAMDFVDAVFELSLRGKEKYHRWLTVKKMPGIDYVMKPTPYKLTHKGIILKGWGITSEG
ncbi:MAG: RAD55 family ATPase [Candidatus Hadarchaeaceae archaeon]